MPYVGAVIILKILSSASVSRWSWEERVDGTSMGGDRIKDTVSYPDTDTLMQAIGCKDMETGTNTGDEGRQMEARSRKMRGRIPDDDDVTKKTWQGHQKETWQGHDKKDTWQGQSNNCTNDE